MVEAWKILHRWRRAIVPAACLLLYPLWAILVFAELKVLLVGWALWQTYPSQDDGRLNVIPPVARSLRWAEWVFSDLWLVITLDPMVVGATRPEAVRMIVASYAVAVMVSAASMMVGLHMGRWVCRLGLRPGYCTRRGIGLVWTSLLAPSLTLGVSGAYLWAFPIAALGIVCSRTMEGGAFLNRHVTPPIFWMVVLLSAPAVSGTFAMVRAYRMWVEQNIAAELYLCDCGYECRPEAVCPECGTQTRPLPATLRWRW